MNSIAIITARGGSKRIPRKNIKEFCGKPIIAYSITAALESGCFDEVMVSTDDKEIADVAIKYGAKVPFMRSDKTSNDFATTADVIKEVLECYEQAGKRFGYACCIYPTAPFVTSNRLREAMEMICISDVYTVMPVVQYSFPPQRAVVLKEGLIVPQYPEFMPCRSQDLEKIYHDCGQFYAFNVQEFIKTGVMIGEKVAPIIMNELEVQDIDNETDWKLAEIKYKLIHGEVGGENYES